MLRRATKRLSASGKVLTASLGSHFVNLTRYYPHGSTAGYPVCAADASANSMEACCAFGEDKFYDIVGPYSCGDSMFVPFRQYNLPSRDFGDTAHGGNDTLGCAAAVEDAALEMQSRPGFYCNNDGWPNMTDGGLGWSRHNVSLAAYLLAAANPSYFASGLHWTDLIVGSNGLRAWPAWPDFKRALGRPMGRFHRDGFVYTRRFEHAHVSLNCSTLISHISWSTSTICSSDLDCSLNGVCGKGVCVCDAAWTGTACDKMALLPTPAKSDFREDSVSTWGGSIVYETSHPGPSWHMYASEMLGSCGIESWQSNSQVIHATSSSPLGPWRREPGVTLHVWAHCPNGAVTPDGVVLLPRLWCTPRKYPAGTPASCKSGVRRCLPHGGQCCKGGASPCGFKLHEGVTLNCTSAPHLRKSQSILKASPKAVYTPGASSFISFAASYSPYGEFTENATMPILGWGGTPGQERDGFYGIIAPWVAKNGTTWMFNENNVLIRADSWNGTYKLINANCLPAGWGEDPMLWLDHRDNLHIVYHKFAGSDYGGLPCTATGSCGGHAYSSDGGRTWAVGPTAYNGSVTYANGQTVEYLTRQRPHVVLDPQTSELIALSTGVTVCAFPNCTASNMWPGYTDRGFTSVQPFRRRKA